MMDIPGVVVFVSDVVSQFSFYFYPHLLPLRLPEQLEATAPICSKRFRNARPESLTLHLLSHLNPRSH